jgi:hypothetical protein
VITVACPNVTFKKVHSIKEWQEGSSVSYEAKLYSIPHRLLACSGKSAASPELPGENNPV